MHRPAFAEFTRLADGSGPRDAGMTLFYSYHLNGRAYYLTDRLAKAFCENAVVDEKDARQLFDHALGLSALHSLTSTGISPPDALTERVDKAMSTINFSTLFHLDQLDKDEFLCDAIFWQFVFARAHLTGLDPFKVAITIRLKQRRQEGYPCLTGDAWRWQARLVISILYSQCKWGSDQYSLCEKACKREIEFILENMSTAIKRNEANLVGQFIHCLVLLEHCRIPFENEAKQLLQEHVIVEDESFYEQCHGAWCKVVGLKSDCEP